MKFYFTLALLINALISYATDSRDTLQTKYLESKRQYIEYRIEFLTDAIGAEICDTIQMFDALTANYFNRDTIIQKYMLEYLNLHKVNDSLEYPTSKILTQIVDSTTKGWSATIVELVNSGDPGFFSFAIILRNQSGEVYKIANGNELVKIDAANIEVLRLSWACSALPQNSTSTNRVYLTHIPPYSNIFRSVYIPSPRQDLLIAFHKLKLNNVPK